MLQLQIKSDSPNIETDQNLVKAAIASEIKNLKRSLAKTDQKLKEFETKYKILSDYFLDNWTAEDLENGDDEYITWVGEIQIKATLLASLEKLEGIEYVTTVLQLSPINSSPKYRHRGIAKGQIQFARDFDEPLEDFREYME